jgi:hypothetical protein
MDGAELETNIAVRKTVLILVTTSFSVIKITRVKRDAGVYCMIYYYFTSRCCAAKTNILIAPTQGSVGLVLTIVPKMFAWLAVMPKPNVIPGLVSNGRRVPSVH